MYKSKVRKGKSKLLYIGMLTLAFIMITSSCVVFAESKTKKDIYKVIERKKELLTLQNKLPLTIYKALWVDEVRGYGMYKERAKKGVFKQQERGTVYIEPINFGTKKTKDGYKFSISLSARVRDTNGTPLSEVMKVSSVTEVVKSPLLDLYLTLDMGFSGWPPGKYLLEIIVGDNIKGTEATFKIPVEVIAEKKR